jgi:hypothetical protein
MRTDVQRGAKSERKRAEGKSFKEAMRCLKRHLAKVIYRRLRTDAWNVEIAA